MDDTVHVHVATYDNALYNICILNNLGTIIYVSVALRYFYNYNICLPFIA